MDITTVLRRLRAHGFAITMLVDAQLLKFVSSRALNKPLIDPASLKAKSLWAQFELMSFKERMILDLCKRYLQILQTTRSLEKTALVAKDLPICLLYTSPSPRDATLSRMPSSA